MKVGDIEIIPIAAESMGVRSLCTNIITPDLNILLDPSAALSMRFRLEPHPLEYQMLLEKLEKIFVAARKADILSISHYHYDHVRPGFTNFRYNFSSLEEIQLMFQAKKVISKDYRENINPSQRRRGYYFEKEVKDVVDSIQWADGIELNFNDTTLSYSSPLPHGPKDSRLGFVVATMIGHSGTRIVFAPDVQGPLVDSTLSYLLGVNADLLIIGGPPLYLDKFSMSDRKRALTSLTLLAQYIPLVTVDHHLMRSENWKDWLNPVYKRAFEVGHEVMTMAELAGEENFCLEAKRKRLYEEYPPSEDFMNWIESTDEYKMKNKPPINSAH